MTPKEYLMQYRDSLTRADELKAHLAELRALTESLKDEHGEHVALDAAVANLVDAQAQTAAELENLCRLRAKILSVIGCVPRVRYRELLTERYINGRTLVQIAADRNQSYEHICRLHGAALCAVSELLP